MRVIGFGNRYRGDDGVGPHVAETLRGEGLDARELAGDGLALAEAVRGCGPVVVVDAMRSGAPPGTIEVLDASALDRARDRFPASSHVFGAAAGLELARRLGWLGGPLHLVGVEGESFSHGAGLSPAVAAAVPQALARVRELTGAGR